MSKFKKITFLWILSISVFLIFNFLIFFNYTSKVYPDTADTTIGDLARMSYMVDIIQERKNIVDLEKLHISQNEYKNETIDVLTIGDSFSNGNVGGKNSYYQDYISTIYNKKVLNLNMQNVGNTSNYIEIIALFANSGYLEKIGVKYVLIESVQREALVRFARNDLNLAIKTDKNLETIFRNLKISDSFTPLSTQIFKSINIKKEKSHQSKRGEKVNQIANFTESIKVGESTEITINISDKYFDDLMKKYNGTYLYNRCHLIGYQLSDEDANKQNLITGTRYFNVEGMLPFENQVAEYIKKQKTNEFFVTFL